ncbi:MAG: hypothetical protein LBE51_08750 [Acidovorax sp.]|jgi:hypothetical protein|nr:hypothetical protein [Acidovorax sp.]
MSTSSTAIKSGLFDADGTHWQSHHHAPDFKSHAELQGVGVYSDYDQASPPQVTLSIVLGSFRIAHHAAPNAARALGQALLSAASRAEEVAQQLDPQQAQG